MILQHVHLLQLLVNLWEMLLGIDGDSLNGLRNYIIFIRHIPIMQHLLLELLNSLLKLKEDDFNVFDTRLVVFYVHGRRELAGSHRGRQVGGFVRFVRIRADCRLGWLPGSCRSWTITLGGTAILF